MPLRPCGIGTAAEEIRKHLRKSLRCQPAGGRIVKVGRRWIGLTPRATLEFEECSSRTPSEVTKLRRLTATPSEHFQRTPRNPWPSSRFEVRFSRATPGALFRRVFRSGSL